MFRRDKRPRLGGFPVAGRICVDAFLADGRSYVQSLGVEPDAYDIALTMLEVIRSRDTTLRGDQSELIWTDASMDVDLGHRRFLPTEFVIEIVGAATYFLGCSGYPPYVYGGMLPDRDETGPRRWTQVPPGIELDENSADVIRAAADAQLLRMFDPEIRERAVREQAIHTAIRSGGVLSPTILRGPPVWTRATRRWLVGCIVCIVVSFAFFAVRLHGGAAWSAVFWLPLFGALVVPIWLTSMLVERARRPIVGAWYRSRGRLCPSCAYDVSGLAPAGSCPECGNAYDIDRDTPLWREVGLRRPHDVT